MGQPITVEAWEWSLKNIYSCSMKATVERIFSPKILVYMVSICYFQTDSLTANSAG